MVKKKILTVVGARPQFIKCAALSKEVRKYFTEIIVHTGQHYDKNLSEDFFTELNIPSPDYNLNAISENGVLQIADIMVKLNKVVLAEKPDCIIVFGDTNSTAAASIVAAKNQIKLAHVEAGMREFDKSIPEETNKLITDILADYYFCATPTALKWLSEMGISNNVFHTGDIMIDLIELFRQNIELNNSILNRFRLNQKQYIFATCHRAANTENKNNLKEILSGLSQINIPIVLPLHPRTKKAIEHFELSEYLSSKNIIVCEPLGYVDTQTLIMNAHMVITDSGGVTKECYYHKVPGILTDTQTEWIETVSEGWNVQVGPVAHKIVSAFNNCKIPNEQHSVLGKGDASKKIAAHLNALLN
ncbi:MAG TPA: UDP-N-acetylglucosamine 2-epimerase (non-hydrolyzing) [Bacteroidia bacterium]|nr:UDP-N-acetylglucosamine 2-epimerase (non-hydrolyzing) [Bacteroidia bacterium]